MIRVVSTLLLLANFNLFAKSRQNYPGEETQLRLALESYERKNYVNAVILAEPLIEGLQLHDLSNILLAHQVISLSHCENKNVARAEVHAKIIFDFDPSFHQTLSSTDSCKNWFTSQFRRYTKKHLSLSSSQSSSWLLGLAPLGIAQFNQNKPVKGWLLLGTQTLFMGLGLSSYFLFKSGQNSDGTVANGNDAQLFRALNWIGLSGAGLSYSLGAIDAYSSLPRR